MNLTLDTLDNLSISSILTISILLRSCFKVTLNMQATNTINMKNITQYKGSFSHNLVAAIEATIPTIYDTKVIIPFDIGSLIGYVNSVQKLYPTEQIGNRQNPNIPILTQTKYSLPLFKEK